MSVIEAELNSALDRIARIKTLAKTVQFEKEDETIFNIYEQLERLSENVMRALAQKEEF